MKWLLTKWLHDIVGDIESKGRVVSDIAQVAKKLKLSETSYDATPQQTIFIQFFLSITKLVYIYFMCLLF